MNVRCFVAVEPEPVLRETLSRASVLLRGAAPDWTGEKWVPSANLHATLRFFGELRECLLPSLQAELAAATTLLRPFSLPFGAIAGSPSADRCRIVWARFDDPAGEFRMAASALSRAISRHADSPDPRPALPHVTLCRARRPHPIPQSALDEATRLMSCTNPTMSVASVTLFASRLTPGGPVYKGLGTWHLGGSDTS